MSKWTRDALRREEVRGVFAIGVVALLISWRQVAQTALGETRFTFLGVEAVIDLDLVINSVTLMWALYILLIAMSLGDSLLEPGRLRRFVFKLRELGYAFFFLGTFVMLAAAVFMFLPLIWLPPLVVFATWIYGKILLGSEPLYRNDQIPRFFDRKEYGKILNYVNDELEALEEMYHVILEQTFY